MTFLFSFVVEANPGHADDPIDGNWRFHWPEESMRDARFHVLWDHTVLCQECCFAVPDFLLDGAIDNHMPKFLIRKFYDEMVEAQADALGRAMADPDIPHEQVRGMLIKLISVYHMAIQRKLI